jgi:hypothetical protein
VVLRSVVVTTSLLIPDPTGNRSVAGIDKKHARDGVPPQPAETTRLVGIDFGTWGIDGRDIPSGMTLRANR